jgi:hypothetical protein
VPIALGLPRSGGFLLLRGLFLAGRRLRAARPPCVLAEGAAAASAGARIERWMSAAWRSSVPGNSVIVFMRPPGCVWQCFRR